MPATLPAIALRRWISYLICLCLLSGMSQTYAFSIHDNLSAHHHRDASTQGAMQAHHHETNDDHDRVGTPGNPHALHHLAALTVGDYGSDHHEHVHIPAVAAFTGDYRWSFTTSESPWPETNPLAFISQPYRPPVPPPNA